MGIRAKPDMNQVKKLITKLEPFDALSTIKRLDVMFDGINSYEQGPNIATVAMVLRPNETEIITEKDKDGLDVDVSYPTLHSVDKAGGDLRQLKRIQQDKRQLVVYPNRGPDGNGEWRYFNMQRVDEWKLVEELDKVIIRALKRSINVITTILKENPEYRNSRHKVEVQDIRYDVLKKRRELKRLQKKKQILASGETVDNEDNEK